MYRGLANLYSELSNSKKRFGESTQAMPNIKVKKLV